MKWISVNQKMPKSKIPVLVYFNNLDKKKIITIAEYIKEKEELEEDYLHPDFSDGLAEYDEINDCCWAPGGWYEIQNVSEVNWYLGKNITHWMYLPKLPKNK